MPVSGRIEYYKEETCRRTQHYIGDGSGKLYSECNLLKDADVPTRCFSLG